MQSRCCCIQLLKQVTDFDETLYRRYAFGCHPSECPAIDSQNMAGGSCVVTVRLEMCTFC
jgi:hypothetical protein